MRSMLSEGHLCEERRRVKEPAGLPAVSPAGVLNLIGISALTKGFQTVNELQICLVEF